MLARSAAVLAAAEWLASGEFALAASPGPATSAAGVQKALVETILPIGDPAFPRLSAAEVSQQMDALFGLARERGLRRELVGIRSHHRARALRLAGGFRRTGARGACCSRR